MNATVALFRRRFSLVLTLLLAAAGQGRTLLSQQPKLTLLDGTQIGVQSIEIGDGKIAGQDVPAGLTLDDLRQIHLAAASPVEKPAIVVQLRGGGQMIGKSASIADDKCVIEWALGDSTDRQLSLPIDAVRAIRFVPATANAEFDKAVAAPVADADRIFFQVEGKYDSIGGLIVSLGERELTFQFEGEERTLPRSQLYGIVVAQPQAEDEPTRVVVALRDGSQLAGDLTAVADNKAMLELPGGGQLEFPWSAVARVVVRSSRVAFLSDLKPLTVEESALVTLPRPWQRDKSVSGRPLQLGARTFDKGIGVHARSSLTFSSGGKYDALSATIGLDSGGGGRGDCVFSILGDGQPIFTKRVKGSDAPQEMNVEIAPFAEITLLVEPGAGLDLADHANWCEVRMIKSRK